MQQGTFATLSLSDLRFGKFAERNSDAQAVVEPDGTIVTRGLMSERINRLSHSLRAQGVGRGSVMALIAPNSAEFLVCYLAATQIGMYVVPVNWHLAAPEIRHIVNDCGAMVLVCDVRFRSVIESVLSGIERRPSCCISLHGTMPDFLYIGDLLTDSPPTPITDQIQGRVLSYTSATTGKPRGVLLPLDEAERVLNQSLSARMAVGTLPEKHVQLCAAMLYHGAPLEGVISSLHLGHKVVLMDRMEPEMLLNCIDRYQVTMAYIVPSMFRKLLMLDPAVRRLYSTATLRKVVHAGSPCPVSIKQQMIDWWGPIFLESYGATEGAGTIATSQDWMRFPGTVGKPIPGTRIMIVGDDGIMLPPNAVGIIYMTRYTGDRFEYLHDRVKTEAVHMGDFFTAGDVGYLNEEGFLFLCDRKADVININGSKVYPAELEVLLLQHPDIADCVVLGIPDTTYGESILAVVCPSRTAPKPEYLKRGLVRWLSEHVAVTKLPRHFLFLADLPRDASGKIQRRELRKTYGPLYGSFDALSPGSERRLRTT